MAIDRGLIASVVRTPVEDAIPPETLQSILSNPPFISVPGSMNIRDVAAFSPGYIKAGIIFRSGTLDFIPEPSRSLLRSQLGLHKIFDFRRNDEVKRPLCQVDGLEVVSCPFWDGAEANTDTNLAEFALKDGETVTRGYRGMYDVILKGYTTGYRKVFDALKTANPDGNAVLYHCAGGKDRTGVMTALIMDIMQIPTSIIADEYALTRIGVEPMREKMLASAILGFAPDAFKNSTEESKIADGMGIPGMREVLSTPAAVMEDFMDMLKTEYGGAEGYLKNHLGFEDADIEQIRINLRPDTSGRVD